jgi:hypothetical protein
MRARRSTRTKQITYAHSTPLKILSAIPLFPRKRYCGFAGLLNSENGLCRSITKILSQKIRGADALPPSALLLPRIA